MFKFREVDVKRGKAVEMLSATQMLVVSWDNCKELPSKALWSLKTSLRAHDVQRYCIREVCANRIGRRNTRLSL